MATGVGLGPERARASKRIMEACMAEPFYVAGTGRTCTRLMEIAPGRIFVKTGAEGVFCAALPERGLGIAVKCDDGASRAAEVVVATVIAALLGRSDAPELERFLTPTASSRPSSRASSTPRSRHGSMPSPATRCATGMASPSVTFARRNICMAEHVPKWIMYMLEFS
jgi:hypothetical protein